MLCSPPRPRQSLILFLCLLFYLLQNAMGFTHYVSICIEFLSFRVILFYINEGVAYVSNSILLYEEQYSTVRTYLNLSIHQLISFEFSLFVCFVLFLQVSAIMNKTAINVLYSPLYFFISPRYILRSRIVASQDSTLLKNLQTVFQRCCIPTSHV